eukprot:TRINITY_DN10279_c0_g1_i1.p1 TRINITY_DN10279_c0_g1~~TRINITY_DN10279_c0_g1_i1.p1  ORF type:complete len:371 (-),score=84.24 TRINITY_DN10279_c0_g1_i1:400-1452(-)
MGAERESGGECCFAFLRGRSRGASGGKRLLGADEAVPHVQREPWPKTVILVRHGESTYNVYHEAHHTDPLDMFDAPLTLRGQAQARTAARELAALQPPTGPVQVALTSPLTRAAQTCLLALPPSACSSGLRYEVCAGASEHLEASCDIGRSPAELKEDFPELDFSRLPDVWWWTPSDDLPAGGATLAWSRRSFREEGRRESRREFCERVDKFAAFLAARSEATIAVFAHADFFNTFLERHVGKREPKYADYWMKNCEVLCVSFNSALELQPPKETQTEAEAVKPEVAAAESTKVAAPTPAQLAMKVLRDTIKSENPDFNDAKAMRTAALQWKNMSQEERQKRMQDAAASH